MSIYAGSFTPSANGSFSIEVPFLPDEVQLYASGANGSNENDQGRLSVGFATEAYQSCDAMLTNSHGDFSREYHNDNGKCMVILATPAGTISRVATVVHDSFENDSGTYYWNFDIADYNSSYSFQITAKFRA